MPRLVLIVIALVAIEHDLALARSDACSDEIAQLEASIQSMRQPAPKPTLPQTTGAKLHHQPTPESVRRAEEAAQLRFAFALARAKVLSAHGETAECMQALAKAKRFLAIAERDKNAGSMRQLSSVAGDLRGSCLTGRHHTIMESDSRTWCR